MFGHNCLWAITAMAFPVVAVCGAACAGAAFHFLRTRILIHDLDIVFHMGNTIVHVERRREMGYTSTALRFFS